MTTVAETTEFPSSSNIVSATYDPEVENLVLRFASGHEYTYFNVPASAYRGLQGAASAGSFFHRHIKNRFSYEQL